MKGVRLTTHHDDVATTPADADADEALDGGGPVSDDGDGGGGGGGDTIGPEVDVDDEGFVSGLSWPRVAVLGAALLFFGFAVATFVGRDRPPAADSVDVGFYQDMTSHHDQALEFDDEGNPVGATAALAVAMEEAEAHTLETGGDLSEPDATVLGDLPDATGRPQPGTEPPTQEKP